MAETIVAPHGLFYMENAGGCKDEPTHSEISPSMSGGASAKLFRFRGRKRRRLEW